MLLSSYHIMVPNFENDSSALSRNALRKSSEHPRYAIASDFDSHVFWIGSTFPVFLSRGIGLSLNFYTFIKSKGSFSYQISVF